MVGNYKDTKIKQTESLVEKLWGQEPQDSCCKERNWEGDNHVTCPISCRSHACSLLCDLHWHLCSTSWDSGLAPSGPLLRLTHQLLLLSENCSSSCFWTLIAKRNNLIDNSLSHLAQTFHSRPHKLWATLRLTTSLLWEVLCQPRSEEWDTHFLWGFKYSSLA